MGDTLKIFFSTIILVLVTSIVFFALYFLFPDISEQTFGISYRSSKEEPLETLNMILEKTAPESSASLLEEEAQENQENDVLVLDESNEAEALDESSQAEALAESSEAQEIKQEELPALTEDGQDVLSFFNTAKGRTLIGSVGMIGGLNLDLEAISDTVDGRKLINTVGEYLSQTGQSMGEIFSNKAIMSALTGKVDDKIAGLLSYLKEEGAI